MPSDPAPYIQFFPSFRCTQECSFCFNRGFVPEGDISVSRFEAMLDILASAGIDEIDILGGEPTLHPGLPEMITAASVRRMKVSLSSNGVNADILAGLSERINPAQLTIGISLNNVEVDDQLHHFIIEKRPLLKGIASRHAFVPVAAQRYLEEVDISYYALFMDTLTKEDLAASLSFTEYMGRLGEHRERFPRTGGVYCGGFVPDLTRYPSLDGARCPAGITKLSITPDGDVYPCYLFFRYKAYRLGNIFRDGMKAIMEQEPLSLFRDFAGNRCPVTACALFDRCHGGCPAVSLLCCGDATAPDPRCAFRLYD